MPQKAINYMLEHKESFIYDSTFFISPVIKDYADKYNFLSFSEDTLIKANFNISSTIFKKNISEVKKKISLPVEVQSKNKYKSSWLISPSIKAGEIYCVFAKVESLNQKRGREVVFIFDKKSNLIRNISSQFIY